METMHVNPKGEPVPAPVMCPESNPRTGRPCDFSQGHVGNHVHVRVLWVPGGRKGFPLREEWMA